MNPAIVVFGMAAIMVGALAASMLVQKAILSPEQKLLLYMFHNIGKTTAFSWDHDRDRKYALKRNITEAHVSALVKAGYIAPWYSGFTLTLTGKTYAKHLNNYVI